MTFSHEQYNIYIHSSLVDGTSLYVFACYSISRLKASQRILAQNQRISHANLSGNMKNSRNNAIAMEGNVSDTYIKHFNTIIEKCRAKRSKNGSVKTLDGLVFAFAMKYQHLSWYVALVFIDIPAANQFNQQIMFYVTLSPHDNHIFRHQSY